jgi:hypothetical protein
MWDELATWMGTDWYPRAHQAGLLRHAVVYAENFFGYFATTLGLARVDGDSQLVGFSSEAPAVRCYWSCRPSALLFPYPPCCSILEQFPSRCTD